MAQDKYSIIIPTYNEVENIPLVQYLLDKTFKELDIKYELVVVDDSSPDGTADAVRKLQNCYGKEKVVLVSRPGKLGLGSAYVEGLKHISGNYVVLMDADLSHHVKRALGPKYLKDFIRVQRSTGCHVVTGSRYAHGGGVAGWNLKRKLLSRGANLLAQVLLQPGVSDLTGSFRLFKADVIKDLMPKVTSKGYAFQMEVIVRARYQGFTIQQVPIVFVDRLFGESKLGAQEVKLYLVGLAKLLFTL